ncbi:MAG: DUF262 domain-containing protein [Candidatus Staskawiczbacteria bacterium]|nr:DUF262 domain-containing protein [Candidatus Staskawiczbacteria bacterium]
MKIGLKKIPIKEVIEGYKDNEEEGVTAYNGKLDIRPKYQREFVYKPEQRDAVIETIRNSFPLNVMYWMKKEDGGYEVLDGQQRTISIGQYMNGDFSVDFNGRLAMFHNLTKEEQNKILDYELFIYLCEGTDKERIDWFTVINTYGEKVNEQEIRNAVYTGPWLSDAKLKFSKSNCVAYLLANDGGQLVSGSPIRQDYLETALSWINNGNAADYMAKHQHDKNADELWNYFQNVIAWTREVFPKYRREMKNVNWGKLYNEFNGKKFDSEKSEKEIVKLMEDKDVTSKPGIYEYVLTRNEKFLNIRAFENNEKREAYEKQKGKCKKCKKHFEIEEMEADHIKPWHEGGKTVAKNCQMLCRDCNRAKSGK